MAFNRTHLAYESDPAVSRVLKDFRARKIASAADKLYSACHAGESIPRSSFHFNGTEYHVLCGKFLVFSYRDPCEDIVVLTDGEDAMVIVLQSLSKSWVFCIIDYRPHSELFSNNFNTVRYGSAI